MPSRGHLQRIMSGDVVTADPGATLRELADTMVEDEVGSVVIIEEGQVVGIVSERDIVVAVAEQIDLSATPARDVMSAHPLCADIDDSVDATVERMVEAGVLHVPVLRQGRASGMLSARDLLSRWGVTDEDVPGIDDEDLGPLA